MSKLSNADFRSMMMTPRRESSDDSSNPMPPPKKIASRKRPTPSAPKENPPPTPKRTTPTDSKYRDRAAERREGTNQDYNSEEMEMLSSYHNVPPDATSQDLHEARLEAIEKSKYLGGDMEHTHLVKGLDFALLQKARSETLTFVEAESDEEEEKEQKIEETFYKTISKDVEQKEDIEEEKPTTIHFKGIVAKSVHYNLFSKKIPQTNDLFVNGRTVFQFDLESKRDIPTVVVKSKETDIPKYKELMKGEMDGGVLEKIMGVMAYVRGGGSKKKGKKEENVAATEVKKSVVVEDEEIFPDAGKYVPSIPEPNKQGKKISYFGDSGKDEMEIEAPVIPEAWKKSIENAKKNKKNEEEEEEEEEEGEYVFDINKFDEPIDTSILEEEEAKKPKSLHTEIEEARKKRAIDPKKDPTYIDNDYAECYPGTYESTFVDYDEGSDEEEDLSKMDVGKNLRLHRKDFASEEAWSSYNDKREAMPRAAFQFGVKMADGRKTRKNKDQTQKIESELKKINNIIKKSENIKSTPVPTAIEARKKMKN